MKKSILLYLIVSTVLLASNSIAQFNLNSASLQVGAIDGIAASNLVLYPEVQIGGFFGESFIQWSLYWGHWDDGIHEVTGSDYITYSYHGHIAGARILFFPLLADEHWPLPIALFGGLSHHFIARTYIGGGDESGKVGSDGTESVNTIEAGLRVYLKIAGPVELRGEVHQFFRLGNESLDIGQNGRRAYTIGLGLIF